MPAYCPFPGEILDAFIDALGTNLAYFKNHPLSDETWAALIACLSVSRSLRARARVYIFRHIDLNNIFRNPFVTLVSRLRALTVDAHSPSDDISPLIRELHIPSQLSTANYAIDNPDLTVVLARLSAQDCHLQQLSIGNRGYPSTWESLSAEYYSAVANLLRTSSLTTLELHNVVRFPKSLLRGCSFDSMKIQNICGADHESESESESESDSIGQPLYQAPTFIRKLEAETSSLGLLHGLTMAVEEMVLTFDLPMENWPHLVHNFIRRSAESLVSLTFEISDVICFILDTQPSFPLDSFRALKYITFDCTDLLDADEDDGSRNIVMCLPETLSSIAHILESSQQSVALEQVTIVLAWESYTEVLIKTLLAASPEWSRLDDLFSQNALGEVAHVVMQLTVWTIAADGLDDRVQQFVESRMPKLSRAGRLEVGVDVIDTRDDEER